MLRSSILSLKTVVTTTSKLLNKNSNLFPQQIRTTYVLKRKHPPRLDKKDETHHKFTKNDFYYELVENTDIKKKESIDIILMKDVEKFGQKGTVVKVSSNIAYHKLLLPKLGIYATPENIEKYKIKCDDLNDQSKSKLAVETLKILERCCLIVYMNQENTWQLEKWHIRVNFRRCGIYVTDESITMPKNEIHGPNLNYQGKEFYIILSLSKTESVKVRCRLFHINSDNETNDDIVNEIKTPGDAIFAEDQSVLNTLPRPKWEKSDIKDLTKNSMYL